MSEGAGMMQISMTLNGKEVSADVDPGERLLDTLRYALGLTGTKEGCGEGECGACSVLMDGVPVNSCLVPSYQARGRVIETVEHVQESDVEPLLSSGATQCGACTPGIVVTAQWVRRHPELLETHTLRELMAGNLCRCTGYDGVIEGVEATLTVDGQSS